MPRSYQAGLSGVQHSGRNVPDIALPAGHNGLCVGGWETVWRTSWATPIYAAMQSEINQACAAQQWGINTLYNTFANSGYRHDFIDVVDGATRSRGYSARRRWPASITSPASGSPSGRQSQQIRAVDASSTLVDGLASRSLRLG